ncbi:uncharacterized protein LOC125025325 [Penaeus chinensis]|uniref:uncharacterized protein LOC125025325 n=1 Tax=Penaeus chinensis TaxID=139456 RepID=UPI001FB5C3B5|nr:uncharacterized protein LOC125025325 [Penaeus chinensis]
MASQGTHPACLFLALTLLVTTAATMILCSAILTNHWEVITFDKAEVEAIAAKHNASHTLSWLWGGKVGMVSIELHQPLKLRRQDAGSQAYMGSHSHSIRFRRQTSKVIYLVPMHGGIWTLCVGLSVQEQNELQDLGFPLSGCINYLSPHFAASGEKNDWVQRMQNLSISCALVCCILLGASAVVGTFGIIKRQISAVLITGVMYILAATFGLFCLSIMHFKRKTKKDCGVLDSQVTPEYSSARVFQTGWSLDLGWGGVVTCLVAALLWLLLARIMRYNPISLS